MNTQRPTPRTDAHIRENVGNGTRYSDIAKFARELESEVAFKHGCWMLELQRVSGLERENEAMRAAIQEAGKAFEFITSNWTERDLKPSETIRQVFHAEKIAEAKSALAALKPFLPETPTE